LRFKEQEARLTLQEHDDDDDDDDFYSYAAILPADIKHGNMYDTENQ